MKRLLFTTILFLFTISLFAQFPGGGFPGKAAPNQGHVFGKLTDSTGKPVVGASVLVLQSKFDSTTKKSRDVLVKGITTSSNGEFNFEELPTMGLKIKISATGFKEIDQPVPFFDPSKMQKPADASQPPAQPSFDKDLGKIVLKGDAAILQGVTVVSSTPTMKMDIDKKTFNVEKNIVTEGGTAVDVMRNVPSVQVDIDGNVKLRNAAPQLYIDGRPTTLTLDQIPADAIQSVEVITNPSAKYDASGGNAGILNIVLKKNKQSGYNGNVMAGVDSRGGINGGGNFNIRKNKINLTAAVMVNHNVSRATGTTDRYTYGTDESHVYQNNLDKSNGTFMFGRLGLDYYVTNKTTLSISGIHVHGKFNQNSTITSDSINISDKNLMNYNNRYTTGDRTFDAYGLQGGMVHNFKKDGEQLTADGNFFSGTHTSNSVYNTNYYAVDGSSEGNLLQQQLSDGDVRFLTLQTDYVNPLSKNSKLEAGLRAQFHNLTNNTDNYNADSAGGFIKNPAATNNYKNNDEVYAAYASFTSSIKSFGYQIGLRGESSSYKGYVTNTGEKFSNNYPISLFPSVFLSQKLKHDQELQLNFSRRVNRPNFFQLIPYTDSTDLTNITRGNPNLVPEFTNSFEFSYSKNFKKGNSLLASVYYKHTDNLITRYIDSSTNSAGKTYLINTYVNAASSYNYGAELTSINSIAKWWDMTTNLNLYQSKINTSNLNVASQDAILSWFGKWNNNFKLPASFVIQLSVDYQSKSNLPVTQNQNQQGPPGMQAQSSSQGYIKPFWGTDIAIRKSFLKGNKASVTLSVNDIFKTRYNEQISQSDVFYQDYYRLNNPQTFRLNFSYRFGKMDLGGSKRKTKQEANGDATQGLQ